ncbi:hypothetical protein NLY39_11165 [Pseudomonas sp. KHPS1]|nr:hypothetical protein [Pseudomonas sp. KHPS1]ATH82297.1 hypothetical protein CO724_14445 [Pseudomonas mendocina]UTH38663.1 hypothetical protein NLY39_11165 [Pseudomonas sp. KHPS1]
MGQVIELPTDHRRSWRMLEPEYRKVLKRCGIADQQIKSILEEMKGYLIECASDLNTSFSIPDGFTQDQHDAILQEFNRVVEDVRSQATVPFMSAFGVILRLLVQKHLGHYNLGA